MENNNFTPIDVNKLENKGSNLNTILLLIITLTALVLATMLFILIQKKMSQQTQKDQLPTPTAIVAQPTIKPEPTKELISPTISATGTPTLIETTITPVASPTSNLKK